MVWEISGSLLMNSCLLMPVDTLTYQYTGELTVVSLIITYVSKPRLVAGFRASALNSGELAERHKGRG
jgi:hypothetical protein